jgi:hypothetical protein
MIHEVLVGLKTSKMTLWMSVNLYLSLRLLSMRFCQLAIIDKGEIPE